MRIFNGIDEIRAAVGTHLGHSRWHEITQERVDRFADATGDHQWIHLDRERAARGPFGTTIAHGFLTLSLLPMLAGEVYAVEGVRMGVNYGCNRVRFPAPVPVGSRVRAGVELLGVEPSAQGYLVTALVSIEVEGGGKPACVAESLAVVVP
ncbi:MaoC family dehydratase [Streptomyces somaliensis DSM 40738]|uniref:MaoC family dehydratase n=1 Tax=Streptomyces somaliensis (strain ATCC 33201 / DSM 40738 / JCM 12659 / KCTC 9044 / NCTC 11332 / NRRL B-12077 / IP 733) TaxID=1134445 RepID=A0AA44DE34_STRE0|nr:MaoC family dehydratase [Streptomyces somaliensis]MCQ0021787.1 MaoC family dehydratase [Streptomyces somaliensis DSM 40738]NKY14471.1 MaoC family dehydratase [Streptomyces somaliensis DSM 40738]